MIWVISTAVMWIVCIISGLYSRRVAKRTERLNDQFEESNAMLNTRIELRINEHVVFGCTARELYSIAHLSGQEKYDVLNWGDLGATRVKDAIINLEISRIPAFEVYSAPSITCPKCGMTSYNPNDIEHGWCGKCEVYTRGES